MNESKHQQEKNHTAANDQPAAEEAAQQLKGSDADADQSTGFDDQPDLEDQAEQLKGSDADTDA